MSQVEGDPPKSGKWAEPILVGGVWYYVAFAYGTRPLRGLYPSLEAASAAAHAYERHERWLEDTAKHFMRLQDLLRIFLEQNKRAAEDQCMVDIRKELQMQSDLTTIAIDDFRKLASRESEIGSKIGVGFEIYRLGDVAEKPCLVVNLAFQAKEFYPSYDEAVLTTLEPEETSSGPSIV